VGLTAHRAAKNKKNTPAKCIFCGRAHPANYRGCEYYQKYLKKKPNNISNSIVHLHPVTHCYFTSTFLFRLLCGLLMFFYSYKQARQHQRTGTQKKQKGRTSMTKRNQKKEQRSP
jgi:hypothetical protein